MQIGMIGLGRMGANMVRRLTRDGHACVVNDQNEDAVAALVEEGARGSGDPLCLRVRGGRWPDPGGRGGVPREAVLSQGPSLKGSGDTGFAHRSLGGQKRARQPPARPAP